MNGNSHRKFADIGLRESNFFNPFYWKIWLMFAPFRLTFIVQRESALVAVDIGVPLAIDLH